MFLGNSIFSDPIFILYFVFVIFAINLPFQQAQAIGSTAKID
jgi:hypothetical protein